MSDFESLSHSRWNCKYHVVFVPKGRKKELFVKIGQFLGPVFHEFASEKSCKILEGHMLKKIPSKHAVSSVIGYKEAQVRKYIRDQEDLDNRREAGIIPLGSYS